MIILKWKLIKDGENFEELEYKFKAHCAYFDTVNFLFYIFKPNLIKIINVHNMNDVKIIKISSKEYNGFSIFDKMIILYKDEVEQFMYTFPNPNN